MNIRRWIVLGFFCALLPACWQAVETVYDREDFYLPVTADIVSISDKYGPLGIYKINSNNQYVPLYKEVDGLAFENDFRTANLSLVPIDRVLTVIGDTSRWAQKRIFSSEIFPDTERYLLITVASRDKSVGQGLTASYVEGDVFARCNGALHQGSPQYDTFIKSHANSALNDRQRKIAVALAASQDIRLAHKNGGLKCQTYSIGTHQGAALVSLIQSIKAGDKKRAIAEESARAQRRTTAAKQAEQNAQENGQIYNPDGHYIVSRGGVLRLKKGQDRNYQPSYNAYLEIDNGGYPRPYRPGDLVGRAGLYRDTQQINFSNYTFTSQRRCAQFTDPYWNGQMQATAPGVWVTTDTYPPGRAYDGNICVAYEVRVNSCARVRCSARLRNAPANGTTYLVQSRQKAFDLFKTLK